MARVRDRVNKDMEVVQDDEKPFWIAVNFDQGGHWPVRTANKYDNEKDAILWAKNRMRDTRNRDHYYILKVVKLVRKMHTPVEIIEIK